VPNAEYDAHVVDGSLEVASRVADAQQFLRQVENLREERAIHRRRGSGDAVSDSADEISDDGYSVKETAVAAAVAENAADARQSVQDIPTEAGSTEQIADDRDPSGSTEPGQSAAGLEHVGKAADERDMARRCVHGGTAAAECRLGGDGDNALGAEQRRCGDPGIERNGASVDCDGGCGGREDTVGRMYDGGCYRSQCDNVLGGGSGDSDCVIAGCGRRGDVIEVERRKGRQFDLTRGGDDAAPREQDFRSGEGLDGSGKG
jgi:hypothetical protein